MCRKEEADDLPQMRRRPQRAGALRILVDVCPKCRGVWLDRGELDKIIEGERRYYDDDDDVELEGAGLGRTGRRGGFFGN